MDILNAKEIQEIQKRIEDKIDLLLDHMDVVIKAANQVIQRSLSWKEIKEVN